MAFSPRGDVLMLLDERGPPPRPRPHILHHDAAIVPSYGSTPTTPRFSVSRSDSEDDAIGTFIGPRRRGSRRRRPSARSTAALSTTPPAGPSMEEVMSLEQTIRATGTYKPQQAMAVAHVPAAANVDVYGYLAANYLEALYRDLPYSADAGFLPDRVATILEHYARAAAHVQQFRLAQTWRILAYAVDMLLHRRAQYHLDRRMDRHHYSVRRNSEAKAKAKAKALADLFNTPVRAKNDGEETPRKVVSVTSLDKTLHPRSLLSEELESTSNVPTPVARPVPDDSGVTHPSEKERGRKLTPIVEPESFTLPPAAHPSSLGTRKRLDSVPLSVASHDSGATHASTEGYDFYDTAAIIGKPIDVINRRPTPTRVLDHHEPGSPSQARKRLLRQDSEESYVHLFSISDESRRTTGLTASSDDSLTGHAARAAILATLRHGNEEEFESRIRGEELEKSPEHQTIPPFRSMLPRTETDMTAFTDEHHAITQTTTDSFESRFPSQTEHDSIVESRVKQPPSPESPVSPDDDQSPFIVETDYLCWPDDVAYPYPIDPSSGFSLVSSTPLQPYTLISRALAFEAKSSALNASAIILLLKPLLPDDVVDRFQAAAILRQHHSRLMSMKLFAEAALLRKVCMKGWPGGPLLAWGENYPAIFTSAQQGVQASFVCTRCHKPRDVDRSSASTESVWHCERCKAVMAPCAVCGDRDTAPSSIVAALPQQSKIWPGAAQEGEAGQSLTTWWYCPGCGHGGHSSCLQAWHATLESGDYPTLEDAPGAEDSSDGCCPLDGCGHACLPSRRGAESIVVRTEDVSRVVREVTRAAAKATASAAAAAAAAAAAERGAGNATEVVSDNLAVAGHFGDDQHHAETVSNTAGNGGRHGIPVRSDGNDIPQSRAVETVRETLGAAGGLGGPGRVGTGILSSSPGRGGIGVERERRKSVKFVATDERR